MRARRLGPWRALLACTSAALVSAAVPPLPFGVLAWIALAPLTLAVQGVSALDAGQRPPVAAASGALFGALSGVGMHYWLWGLSAFNVLDAIVFAVYFAAFPAAWCTVIVWLRARGQPWVVSGALLWTLLGVLREHLGFLSVPWEPLSQAQSGNARLLQLASLGGAPLVSFVVCLANLAFAQAVRTRDARKFVWAGAIAFSAHGWGAWRLAHGQPGQALVVGVVQPAAEAIKGAGELGDLRDLTLLAAAQAPALIVWPESAVRSYSVSPDLATAIADVAHTAKTPIAFGSADFGKYAEQGEVAERLPSLVGEDQIQLKNQAFLVLPDGTLLGPYTKNRLVPFAETTPLADHVSWPRWLVAHQRHGMAGAAPGLFEIPDGRTVGILICWENLFSDLTARLVRGGAAAIVQLTNDSDFRGSAEPAQHNAASIFRSVEYNRPMVVASSSGPSLGIDSYGRVVRVLGPVGTRGWMVFPLNTASGSTVYLERGLLWLWLSASVALTIVGVRLGWRRWKGGESI